MSEIAPADWSTLLNHVWAVDFFKRYEPLPAGSEYCVVHLRLTVDGRSCEMAINDPYETPNLVRRVLNDRQVMTADTMRDDTIGILKAALRQAQPEYPGNDLTS